MISIFKNLWFKRVTYVVLLIAVFALGFVANDWIESQVQFKVVSVNTPDNVTSAITDRWELQLTDRKTGRVRIYDKYILDAIFYQYQARRSYTQEDRKPEP